MTLAAARCGLRKNTPACGFAESYTRSNREIVGDNSWFTTYATPNTGVQAITSNRLRAVANAAGDGPGSSGTIGALICHSVVHCDPNVVDVSFNIVTGGVTGVNGCYLWAIIAGGVNASSPPVLNSGVMLKMFIDTTTNQMALAKVTATNARTAHNPPSWPAFAANSTITIRAVLTRSTGVLQVYHNGVLQHTSASGDFSGLTGSLVGFQIQQAYASTPFELDNLVAV